MNWKDLARARDLLKNEQTVAIPTETVYGLAARIDRESAVRRIFAVKERPFFDPLIVHVASFEQVEPLITKWPPLALFLASTFWPGPLTLVMPKSEAVNPLITSGLDSVAIRMPAHPFARRLIREAGVPLAAPSANKFGKTSPTTAEHVRGEFGDDVFVVDGGPSTEGLESTVVRVEGSRIVVLRPGSITVEMLEALPWPEPVVVTRETHQASPGHLEHHYMPRKPVVTVDEKHWPLSVESIARIQAALQLQSGRWVELQLSSDAAQAARELYKALRESAEQESDFIVAVHKGYQTGGHWTAIWDRLSRASTFKME